MDGNSKKFILLGDLYAEKISVVQQLVKYGYDDKTITKINQLQVSIYGEMSRAIEKFETSVRLRELWFVTSEIILYLKDWLERYQKMTVQINWQYTKDNATIIDIKW